MARYDTDIAIAEPLANMMLSLIPGACHGCRDAMRAIAGSAPSKVSASQLALLLGLTSRHSLFQAMGSHRLPPIARLRDWARFLYWLVGWERRHTPLVRQAWTDGLDPSVCFRTVRRLTGMNWTRARELGVAHWLGHLRRELGALACESGLAAKAEDPKSTNAQPECPSKAL